MLCTYLSMCDMEEEGGQSSLFCVRRTREEQFHRSYLLGKTTARLVLMWVTEVREELYSAPIIHRSHRRVNHNTSIHLLVLISSLKINLLHPFSRSFLTIFPLPALFLPLYRINYGFNLIIPIIRGDWTQYLRFSAFALSAGLLPL